MFQFSFLKFQKKEFVRQGFFKKKFKGFTLIEMLVTLGIVTMLSVMILAYSRQSESIANLVREGNRIVFEMQKAQSLSMLVLQEDSPNEKEVCGWGIYIDKSNIPVEKFILFADFCEEFPGGELKGNNQYDEDQGEKTEEIHLLRGIEIFETNINSIVFVPPEPKIKFIPDYLFEEENAFIRIRLKNIPEQYYEIQISKVGQVYKDLKTE
jgi:prepilin-type N-terminal cleavage/methylation domain-containing protein